MSASSAPQVKSVDPSIHQANLRKYAKPLLKWFDRHQRDLPWRREKTPYRVWVSEIMLQQTQVATVIDYFNRFVRRFPDVQSLAAAEIEEVLRYWEGLGYYRRARQMHAAAQQIVQHHEGRFPQQFSEVLQLPGIGRYTAGAILSIACDQRLPILEGNTVRLYSRLVGLTTDPRLPSNQRQLWEFAEAILPKQRVGDFNQALMELGSQICLPANPHCHLCPLARFCPTCQLGLQDSIPVPSRKARTQEIAESVLLVQRSGKYLIRKCQPGEWWEGLWDFPRYRTTSPEEMSVALEREFGIRADFVNGQWQCKHSVTRYRITLYCFIANRVRGRLKNAKGRCGWFTRQQLGELAMSSTGRKVANHLQKIG